MNKFQAEFVQAYVTGKANYSERALTEARDTFRKTTEGYILLDQLVMGAELSFESRMAIQDLVITAYQDFVEAAAEAISKDAAEYDIPLATAVSEHVVDDELLSPTEVEDVSREIGLIGEYAECDITLCESCKEGCDVVEADEGGVEEAWGRKVWVPCITEVSSCCNSEVGVYRVVEQ